MSTPGPIATFPWRKADTLQWWVDGQQFYPAMLGAIKDARHEILLETYMIEAGVVIERFVDALCEAARRGVTVRLRFDAVGSSGFPERLQQHLRHAGVETQLWNPLQPRHWWRNIFRTHRKLLVIDGRQVFTGGPGLADAFDPAVTTPAWHDAVISVSGESARDWQTLFMRDWHRGVGRPAHRTGRHPPGMPEVTISGSRVRLNTSEGLGRDPLKAELLKRIRQASGRVWITTAYFLPPRKLRRALIRAARRGVDVRLLLPGPVTDHPQVWHAGRRHYNQLLRAGVVIHEMQQRFQHMKLALVDEWVSTGSCNFDRWNLRFNMEANLEVLDAGLTRTVALMLETDFDNSHRISTTEWQARPWTQRWRESFWGWMLAQVEGVMLAHHSRERRKVTEGSSPNVSE